MSSIGTAAQGSDWVISHWSIQKTCRCGAWGCGLVVDLSVLHWQVDSMILKVFSNLNYYVILWK